jgi:fibronectin-binding autotransporter adhesin
MAAYYFRNSGTDWNTAANWSLTDGGGATGAVPTVADDVFFTVNSGNCTMGASRVCKSINFTGYASQLTVATFTLTVSGDITFQANQSSRIVGTTGTLTCGASGTITSNGGTWPLNFTINNVGGITTTLADNMRVTGSYSASGGSRIVNGFSLYIGSNLTTNAAHSGTTNFIMNGSGTYSGNGICNLEVDTTGNIIITGSVTFTRRFIITAAGSITMTAANVTISNTTSIDLSGRTIGNLTHSFSFGSQTVTYLSDVVCNNFSIGNGNSTYNGTGKVFVTGNYSVSGGSSSGSLIIELIGSGSISTGTMGLVCVVNCLSGTYTLGATLTINNTFTYTSGNVNTGTSTVTLNSGISLSSNGVNWYNISIANGTLILNSLMTVTNNLTVTAGGTTVFTGSAGWICVNLLVPNVSKTITLEEGIAYTTTTSVNMLGTDASRILMQSSSGTNRAIWTLSPAATQSIVYVNGTRIDSSLGQTIWSFGGTLTNTINWNLGSQPQTAAWTFVG